MEKVDSRGVKLNSNWYPHTLDCIRKSLLKMECICGGDDLVKEKK